MDFKTLDEKAKHLAHQYLLSERELISVLMEMDERRLFLNLGYTGVFSYCQRALNFSESQSGYFTSVIRKGRSVPQLVTAISNGDLSVSQARRIVAVVNPENFETWIQKAKELPQKDLEKKVAAENPRSVQEKIKPVAENRHLLTLGISDSLRKKWESAKELISKKQGKVVSLEETLEGVLNVFLRKEDPMEKAKRAEHKKPRKSKEIGRKPIPAFVKHQVQLRDQGKCSISQCRNRIFTHLHHIKPVSQGGQNTVENLTTLCSQHHTMIHLHEESPRHLKNGGDAL